MGIIEQPLDVVSVCSLLSHGQYLEAFAIAVATFSVLDPFQASGLKEWRKAFSKGMPTRGLLAHNVREGKFEGLISGVVTLKSLFATAPSEFTFSTLLLRCVSITTSLLISGPTAIRSEVIL